VRAPREETSETRTRKHTTRRGTSRGKKERRWRDEEEKKNVDEISS
jgi:hypothetical protein